MRYGDLSNKVAPSIMVVFEGALGILTEDKQEKFNEMITERHADWFKIIKLFDINSHMIDRINFLSWKKDINITIVTWMGKDSEYGLDAVLTENHIVAGLSVFSHPDELAKQLPYRPDILCVYDPEPSHLLKFGSKGFHLRSPSDIGRML